MELLIKHISKQSLIIADSVRFGEADNLNRDIRSSDVITMNNPKRDRSVMGFVQSMCLKCGRKFSDKIRQTTRLTLRLLSVHHEAGHL